ncbi:hypothetical protein [Archangium sp.]|uniref:hypothetical protein n=1 Tax=Archangium sp. TaxID=1872627 RepID=UPI00286A2A6B|nr:hypothetical protein [Archangium sp.]
MSAVGIELLTNYSASETITLTCSDGTTESIADSALGTAPNAFEFIGLAATSTRKSKSLSISTSGGSSQNEGFSKLWRAP